MLESAPRNTLGTPPLPTIGELWALFVDIDGTLVELVAHPELVRIEEATLSLLGRLRTELGGALAILSGRNLTDVDRLLSPLVLPAGALHGLERRDITGALSVAHPPAEIAAQIAHSCRLAAEKMDGVWVEEKSEIAFALHFREVPHALEDVRQQATKIAADSSGCYMVQLGNGVAELKPAGNDKGTALLALLETAPFCGRRPIMLGDDLTDELAFAMAEKLGGVAIVVGNRRPTLAHFCLDSPKDVIEWLQTLSIYLNQVELTR